MVLAFNIKLETKKISKKKLIFKYKRFMQYDKFFDIIFLTKYACKVFYVLNNILVQTGR